MIAEVLLPPSWSCIVMRKVQHCVGELFGRHSGTALWIAGSDPSLTTYPDDFFSGKVGITLHLAHSKFPDATYRYASEYDRAAHYLAEDPSYRIKPFIGAYPMYGYTRSATRKLTAKFSEAYLHHMVSYPPRGIRGDVDPDFTRWKLEQTRMGKATIWGSHGTCLHTAYYIAVLLGAAEINLIGCGHGTYLPGVEHFEAVAGTDKAMRPSYPSFSEPHNIVPVIEQTLALIQGSRELGIRVNWYRSYTPSLDDMVDIDPLWLAEMKEKAGKKVSVLRKLYRQLYKRPINSIISRL